ncbi:MAG: SRPBCC domain-containing protein, partial [Burkholderiales bacterium]
MNRDVRTTCDAFTNPQAITQWNFASTDWRCPKADNMGFDFSGKYTELRRLERIRYSLGDAREVVIEFYEENG